MKKRLYDHVYRLDHAVIATQKTILGAFNLTENDIKRSAKSISDKLAAVRG